MKNTLIILSFLITKIAFGQDTTQVKQTKKISNLLDKVKVISNEHIDNKKQVINKSKIDGLMFKIDKIKTEQPTFSTKKQDSLVAIIKQLSALNLQKDSLIQALKIQLTKTSQQSSITSNKTVITKPSHVIVLGAYLIKSNAEKQVKKIIQLGVEIETIPTGKFYFVVYKLKSKEKIKPTLLKFRKQIEPNAWYFCY